MAEALGIASGVAGIVSLGITICSGLDTFFSAIKDRDDDLKRATELLSLLRRYIELVRPSASTLSSRHAQATDLVVLALGSCEGELRALKELVDNLTKVDGASDVSRKWNKAKSVIAYPLQQGKLTQIRKQLLNATGALGIVIQLLSLHVGQDNHLVMTASLTRLESKVERIEGSAQQIEARLAAIPTGVEEQKTMASSSQTPIKDTSLMLSGKLDAIEEGSWIGPQAQTVGTAQQKDIPRYLRNSMIERKCIQETPMATCLCQGQKDGKGRRPLTYRFWGGLAISYQAMSKGDHQPGCCFYKRSTKTTITYTGPRFLLSKVLSFSLQRDYQCGGSLTTHSLRTYNVRETSQAFDIFGDYLTDRPLVDLATLVQEDIKKLRIAYTSGKASPFDVDNLGRNVAHWCILSYSAWMGLAAMAGSLKRADDSEGLKMMLLFLQQVGVNVYAGTNSDSSMIQFVLREYRHMALGPVYDFLANCESQFDLVQDYESAATILPKGFFIGVMQERPDIMEGLGYRNLFLAVAKRDEARLKELIENIKFVENVRETDLFGQNIVHFCLDWDTGLRLLLDKEATHHLVSQPDAAGSTPLMDALKLSDFVCQKAYGPYLCSGCDCSAPAKLLLEIDCPVGLDLIDGVVGSSRVKITLLQHLAQRRERLRRLALSHLPKSELRDFGVSLNELPDMTAPAIWDRLQSLHPSGVIKELHNGLDPQTENELSDHVQQGIFHLLDDPRDAEVAFNLGFKGIDTPDGDGVTPVMCPGRRAPIWPNSEHRLAYADWLIQKGARLERCANSFGISAAHDLACFCAEWFHDEFIGGRWCVQAPVHIERVLLAVVHSTALSRLPCPCATEELSLPLHRLVVTLLHELGYFKYFDAIANVVHLVDLLSRVVSDLDLAYLVKSIIHVLTLEALRIRHLPACYKSACDIEETVQHAKEEEEWDGMLDEDRALIDRLGELTDEFEQEFSNQNVSIADFLWLHWLPRIRQVRRERKALDDSNRQELRELGVVLDEEIGQDVYYDSADTSESDEDFGDDDSGDDDFETCSGDGEVGENRSTQV